MLRNKSTCVAQSAKRRTSDLDVTASCPLTATRHKVKYKLNLLLFLIVYLCNNEVDSNKHV